MKRIMTTLAMMTMIIVSAAAMSFSKARKEALFLTDKMAYELSLSLDQYEAVYEINLDYLLTLRSTNDLGGVYWIRRNSDLRYVLNAWQWNAYCNIVDFYRPMFWSGSNFSLSLRSRYTNKHDYYYNRPVAYGSYRGGHNTGKDSYYANRNYGAPSAPNNYRNGNAPDMTHRNNSADGHSSRGSSTATHNDNRKDDHASASTQGRTSVTGTGRSMGSSRSSATTTTIKTTTTRQSSGSAANGGSRRGK